MKAISVRNPWAHQIVLGEKRFEYRTWKTDYRGDLLICSSASPKVEGTISGHALVIVKLEDVIEITRTNYRSLGLAWPPAYGEREYAWVLTDRRIIKPFPVKGKLNFYYVDDELLEVLCRTDEMITDKALEDIYGEELCKLFYKKQPEKETQKTTYAFSRRVVIPRNRARR